MIRPYFCFTIFWEMYNKFKKRMLKNLNTYLQIWLEFIILALATPKK